MAGEHFQIYSVQINGNCICETFPSPLHDLIISPHVKLLSISLPKTFSPPCKALLRKMTPLYFGCVCVGGGGGGGV